jgi:transcriptional regulator with XRE-family HTH domain
MGGTTMVTLDVSRVIRRVRKKMGLSQEGLSRRLNATKGAVQHWERGRNRPDLARLFLLRSLCPSGAERRELEGLIRYIQGRVASTTDVALEESAVKRGSAEPGSQLLARENARLRRQVGRLESAVRRRAEQLRILEDLAADLQRQVAELKAAQPHPATEFRSSAISSAHGQA